MPSAHRHLHSFPTRRSSDLTDYRRPLVNAVWPRPDHIANIVIDPLLAADDTLSLKSHRERVTVIDRAFQLKLPSRRSEEHTSELQSHSDLVCRLLLEKKKIT